MFGGVPQQFWAWIDKVLYQWFPMPLNLSDFGMRVSTTFNNPNIAAEYFIMVLPLVIYYAFSGRRSRIRILCRCCLLAALGGIAFSFSRGSYLALLCIVAVLCIANYRKLLTDDTFWLALKNTVFYAVVGVPLVIVLSIYLAHLLNKKLRGRTLYRTLLFIPAVTIPAAIGILWRWILNYQYGIFNWLLEKLGLPRVSWLGDVKYVRWAIILVVVWSMVSTYVIIMLAAMQGIDSSYYEAARLDGASSRQVFFKITLPMLTPMIFFSVIMVTIGILQIFDFIYLMVDRQTLSYTYSMSLVTYFYECAFNKSSMRGYGAAISVVLAIIIMLITIVQMVVKKYWVNSND